MNNMRKAIRISLIIILVYLLIFFIPHKMIQPNSNIQYIYCAFKGEYLTLNDAQVNDILEILSSLQCYRVPGDDKHSIDDDIFEIHLLIEQQPFYVVFGKRNYCYYSNGLLQQFNILNGVDAQERIQNILDL